jgi:hypothetical protein
MDEDTAGRSCVRSDLSTRGCGSTCDSRVRTYGTTPFQLKDRRSRISVDPSRVLAVYNGEGDCTTDHRQDKWPRSGKTRRAPVSAHAHGNCHAMQVATVTALSVDIWMDPCMHIAHGSTGWDK